MILKKNWKEYLHGVRKREIDLIFSNISGRFFERGLEVGCGDGYQTMLIYKYFKKFYAVDLNFERIAKENKINTITYLKCDAENLEECFRAEKFDFIFSSSLLEHLPSKELFLKGSFNLLKDSGKMVVVVPNRFWKLGQFSLHWFNLVVLFINKIFKMTAKPITPIISMGNNLKSKRRYGKIRKLLWPIPHGNFNSNIEEFFKYGRKQWLEKFRKENLKIEKYVKGPVTSGYGFGLDRIRNFLEKIGFSSVHIFFLKK